MAITLRAARVNKGYNQKEAAKLIGVSENVISNWERYVSFPNVRHIKRIEEVYGVSYNDIDFLPKDNGLTVTEKSE